MEQLTPLERIRKARLRYAAACRILAEAMQSPAWHVGTPWQSSVAYRQMVCYNAAQARSQWVEAGRALRNA